MTKENFRKAMLTLASSLGDQNLSKERLRSIEAIIAHSYGFAHRWDRVLVALAKRCKFFPSVAEIVQVMEELNFIQPNPIDRANETVDHMIMACSTGKAFEILGRDDYNLMKNVLGLIPYDIQNGNIDPRFHRKRWVAALERHYMDQENQQTNEALESGEGYTPISLEGVGKELE